MAGKGFPYKDQIDELFIVMVSFCVSSTFATFSLFSVVQILIIFSFLTVTYFLKAQYSLDVLNSNHSVSAYFFLVLI